MAGPIRIPVLTTVVLLALWAATSWWSAMESDRKLEPLGLTTGQEAVDVIVTLAFAPEAFHFKRTQKVGQLVQTDGRDMFVRNADPAGLARLARAYWVVGLAPWHEH